MTTGFFVLDPVGNALGDIHNALVACTFREEIRYGPGPVADVTDQNNIITFLDLLGEFVLKIRIDLPLLVKKCQKAAALDDTGFLPLFRATYIIDDCALFELVLELAITDIFEFWLFHA